MPVSRSLPPIAVVLFSLSACISVEEVVPPENRLAGTSVEVAPSVDAPAFVGVELEESLTGSLDDLAFLAGLTVISVATGSPAQQAGIQRGDRLIAVDGVELEHMDQWGAILAARRPGDTLQVEVERGQGRHEVPVTVAVGGSGQLPSAVRHVEHWKARVVVQSVALLEDDSETVITELVRFLPGSPLEEAGVEVGARVLAVDGEAVRGAGDLVASLAALDFGEEVSLEVQHGGEPMSISLDLWEPPRHVTEASIPILFGYSRDLEGEEVRFALLDLWILSLFEYRREGTLKSWSMLRWLKYETGAGELREVEDEAGAASRTGDGETDS